MVRTRTALRKCGGHDVADNDKDSINFLSLAPSKVMATECSSTSLRRSPRKKIGLASTIMITPSPVNHSTNEVGDIFLNHTSATSGTEVSRRLFRRRQISGEPQTMKKNDDAKMSPTAMAPSKILFSKKPFSKASVENKFQQQQQRKCRRLLMRSTLDSLAMLGAPSVKINSTLQDGHGARVGYTKGKEGNDDRTEKNIQPETEKAPLSRSQIPLELVRIIAPFAGSPLSNVEQFTISATSEKADSLPRKQSLTEIESPNISSKKVIRLPSANSSHSTSRPSLRPRHSQFQHDSFSFSGFQSDQKYHASSDEPSVKRRRGLPPKASTTKLELEPKPVVASDVGVQKKRRGRPPKRTPKTSVPPTAILKVTTMKKKRGRPPTKLVHGRTVEDALTIEQLVERKGGRQPKDEVQFLPNAIVAVPKRKRESPPKSFYKNDSTKERAKSQATRDTHEVLTPTLMDPPIKRKRGRPPKKSSPETLGMKEGRGIEPPAKRKCRNVHLASRGKVDANSIRTEQPEYNDLQRLESPDKDHTTILMKESSPSIRKRVRPRKGGKSSQLSAVEPRSVSSRHAKLHSTFDIEEYSVLSAVGRHESRNVTTSTKPQFSTSGASRRSLGEHSAGISASPLQQRPRDRERRTENALLPPEISPVRRRAVPHTANSPVRRRMQNSPATKTAPNDVATCQFDSSTKKLIIDTALVPEAVVNAIQNQVQECLKQVQDGGAASDIMASKFNDDFAAHLPSGSGQTVNGSTKFEVAHRNDFDGRSVTSELTSDFSKAASHTGWNVSATSRVMKSSHAAFVDRNRPKVSLLSIKHSTDDRRSRVSSSRRSGFWNCSDSLAGSCARSYARFPALLPEAGNVPEEVSLKQSALTQLSTIRTATSMTNKPTNQALQNDEEEAANDSMASSLFVCGEINTKSGHCGTCSGCQRVRDCQTCESCLNKLRTFGPMPPPIGKHDECLNRRCRRYHRFGRTDVLNGRALSAGKNWIGLAKPLPSLKENQSQHSSDEEEEEKVDFASKKAPWEEGDDWSVDYSYLSEPEYRRRMATRPYRKRLSNFPSSTSSVNSKRSWLFPFSRKDKLGMVRSSVTSVSSPRKFKPEERVFVGPSVSAKDKHGRGRGQKRPQDPLYDLGLLQPRNKIAKAIPPIEAWKNDSRSIQELLRYDEADQDWV